MGAKKIVLLVFGLLSLGAIALATLAIVLVPRYVEAEVVRAARERGVELVPGDISFGIGWVQIADARMKLMAVRSVEIRAGLIDAELDGFIPKTFTLNRVTTSVTGDPPTVARELEAWLNAHQGQFREPFLVKPLSVTYRKEPKGAPQAVIEGAELQATNERRALTAKRVRLGERDFGELRLLATKGRARIDLTLGQSALDNPLVTVELDFGGPAERTVHVALSPITLDRLGAVLGLQLPLGGITASGTFAARIPEGVAAGSRITGVVDVLMKGYIPPHPVELDGFVFGDTTALSTRYVVEPEAARVVLTESRVKAGRFELAGGGEIRADLAGAELSLALNGTLPCNALASAMAESRLGRSLGKVSGKAAMQVVAGSVGVRVAVQAKSSEIDKARVLKTITPGCGLKPLTLQELVKLGELVPEALDPKVAKDFESLLKKHVEGLPLLVPPSAMPDFSNIPLPQFPKPGATNKPKSPGTKAPLAPEAGKAGSETQH